MIRTKHPILIGGIIEALLAAGVVAIGVLSGWSNGAIGSAFLGAIVIGTCVLVYLMAYAPGGLRDRSGGGDV